MKDIKEKMFFNENHKNECLNIIKNTLNQKNLLLYKYLIE